MKIELKNIKHSEFASQETNCFAADIYVDGKKVGYCKNDGCGGNTYTHNWDAKTLSKFREVEKYCESLPPIEIDVNGDAFSIKSNLENVVDELFEKWLKEKSLKKMQKSFLKGICIESPFGFELMTFKANGKVIPLSDGLKNPKFIEHVKQYCMTVKADGKKILNTNLPFEI
jgi:hypothetical protein